MNKHPEKIKVEITRTEGSKWYHHGEIHEVLNKVVYWGEKPMFTVNEKVKGIPLNCCRVLNKCELIIEPELELISGEIYVSGTTNKRLVRYKSTNKNESFVLYSQIAIAGSKKDSYWDGADFYAGSIDKASHQQTKS